jgi:hypothetical protein
MRKLRNKKVYELMLELSAQEDPNQENAETDGTLSMPKRELFDKIPEILSIEVKTTSLVATVNVLPDWRVHGVLKLEITKPNLDLLLEQPPAEAAPWTPTIDTANVQWRSSTNTAYCWYWDSKRSKRRYKYKSVDFGPDMDGEAKLDAVRDVADELQTFYDNHHNKGDNMPETTPSKRDRESDGEVSTGTTRSVSVRKAAKPACAKTEKDSD